MHIHVPDGVLPPWLWISGFVILLPFLVIALLKAKKNNEKMVLSAAMASVMLVIFSIHILGNHMNFTPLTGILLGPWWSLISVSAVNIFLAMMGHGGVTVVGLNTLLNWSESLIAWALFWGLIKTKRKGSKEARYRAREVYSGISAFTALMASFGIFLFIISLANMNPSFLYHGSNGKIIEFHLFHILHLTHENNEGGALPTNIPATSQISLTRFAALSFPIVLVLALIESILTIYIVRYIDKVKPEIVNKEL